MDMDGMYIKTLKFDFSVNSLAYHPKTDRLYLTTSGEPQFGYLKLSEAVDGIAGD